MILNLFLLKIKAGKFYSNKNVCLYSSKAMENKSLYQLSDEELQMKETGK